MWQRFTKMSRDTVLFAQEEARRLGENYVSTEHLLLGLTRQTDSVAATVLSELGVSLGRIRSEIERQVARGDGRLGQDLQLTPRAKRVIDLAYDEAQKLDGNYIGTEHLLLGLIREGEGMAGRVFSKLGVELEQARAVVSRLNQFNEETSVQTKPLPTVVQPDENPVLSPAISALLESLKTYQLSDSCNKVMARAFFEAKQQGDPYISTEHLLLGITRVPGCAAVLILNLMGIPHSRVRVEIERQILHKTPSNTEEGPTLTPRTIHALELAKVESEKLGNAYIGTEHLLLGLLQDLEGLAGRTLIKLGADLDNTRAAIIQYHNEHPLPSETSVNEPSTEDTAQPTAPESKRKTTMWQRFTERSRRVVFYAQEEAGRLGENLVSPEHLLLGMIRENDSVAGRILISLGVDLGHLRAEVERQSSPGSGRSGQDMQLAPRAKRVIDLAYDEARKLNNNYIGTEHLLLGLIREEESISAKVLASVGVEYDATVVAVKTLQANKGDDTEAGSQDASSGSSGTAGNIRLKPGDLGTAYSPSGRDYIEVAHDASTFVELMDIFQAKDAHGYRSLLQGNQTMFVILVGTPIKLLVTPSEDAASNAAKGRGGRFIRVLKGDFVGYSGWIFGDAFMKTGPDESPFPPPLTD